MPADLESRIREQLSIMPLPVLGMPLGTVGTIVSVRLAGARAEVDIELGLAAEGLRQRLVGDIEARLKELVEIDSAVVNLSWKITPHVGQQSLENMEQVRNVIAVASGKGGVGKSTTSVNLALALAAEGASVGLLDADIYGPSQQLMLGVEEGKRPEQHGTQHLKPIEVLGIQTMSMGYLVTEKTPMVWRGPMASGALQQLLNQTWWQDLDYLIIDMPPGTGDIQLTLAQKVPVAGAVIVTTPQDLALLDARKGIEMFHKVDVPVLGIVENMAIHICSQCGHQEHLFGTGGGEAIAKDYKVPLLGSLPLSLQIREQSDAGVPVVAAEPDGEVAGLYRDLALRMAAQLASRNAGGGRKFPNIVISND